LKAISKQLGSGKPSWGDIVEHFTGIIKNIEEVNPKQVQALLKDHKILSAKLEKLASFAKERTHRLKHTKVHVDAIKAKSDDYKETKAKLGAKMEDGHIRPIIDWSLTFGEYAARIQQLEAATHEINAH
jgi:galactokinase/mevalonate kinase-like predicted kinase